MCKLAYYSVVQLNDEHLNIWPNQMQRMDCCAIHDVVSCSILLTTYAKYIHNDNNNSKNSTSYDMHVLYLFISECVFCVCLPTIILLSLWVLRIKHHKQVTRKRTTKIVATNTEVDAITVCFEWKGVFKTIIPFFEKKFYRSLKVL